MVVSCLGSVSSGAPAGGGGDLGTPVTTRASPIRPLLLRSDVAWMPESGTVPPVSGSAVSPFGGDFLRPGWANPPVEERVYELPPDVVGRLAIQEALGVAHRRGRGKRPRGDESAELDDAAVDVAGSSAPSRREDRADDDGDEGATGGGTSST